MNVLAADTPHIFFTGKGGVGKTSTACAVSVALTDSGKSVLLVSTDPASNIDGAIHVAHALTVHSIERDLDFMTVVDDLKNRDEGDDSGAAGIFDMELTSGGFLSRS